MVGMLVPSQRRQEVALALPSTLCGLTIPNTLFGSSVTSLLRTSAALPLSASVSRNPATGFRVGVWGSTSATMTDRTKDAMQIVGISPAIRSIWFAAVEAAARRQNSREAILAAARDACAFAASTPGASAKVAPVGMVESHDVETMAEGAGAAAARTFADSSSEEEMAGETRYPGFRDRIEAWSPCCIAIILHKARMERDTDENQVHCLELGGRKAATAAEASEALKGERRVNSRRGAGQREIPEMGQNEERRKARDIEEVLSILGALSDSAHSRFTKWFVSKLTQLEVLASRRVKLTAELVTKRAKKGQVERGKKDLSEARLDRDNTSGGTGTTPYNVHKSAGTGRRIGVGTFNIGPRCGGTGYRARTRQQSEVVLQRSRVGEVVCTEGGIVASGTRPLSPIAAPTPGSPTVSAGFAPAGSSGVLCLGGRETGSGSSATSGGSGDGVGEGARDVGLRGESRGPDIGSDGNSNSTRSNGVDGTSASIGSGPDSKCSFVFGSSAGDVPSSPFSCDRVSIASTGISAGSSSNGFTFGTAGHTGGRRGLVLGSCTASRSQGGMVVRTVRNEATKLQETVDYLAGTMSDWPIVFVHQALQRVHVFAAIAARKAMVGKAADAALADRQNDTARKNTPAGHAQVEITATHQTIEDVVRVFRTLPKEWRRKFLHYFTCLRSEHDYALHVKLETQIGQDVDGEEEEEEEEEGKRSITGTVGIVALHSAAGNVLTPSVGLATESPAHCESAEVQSGGFDIFGNAGDLTDSPVGCGGRAGEHDHRSADDDGSNTDGVSTGESTGSVSNSGRDVDTCGVVYAPYPPGTSTSTSSLDSLSSSEEARQTFNKAILDVLLPMSKWNDEYIGLALDKVNSLRQTERPGQQNTTGPSLLRGEVVCREIIGVFKTLSPTDLLMFVSWVKRHQREFGEDLAVQSCDNKHEADRKRDKEHGRSEEERGAAAVKAESEGQASEVHLAHLRVERVSKMDERARSSLVDVATTVGYTASVPGAVYGSMQAALALPSTSSMLTGPGGSSDSLATTVLRSNVAFPFSATPRFSDYSAPALRVRVWGSKSPTMTNYTEDTLPMIATFPTVRPLLFAAVKAAARHEQSSNAILISVRDAVFSLAVDLSAMVTLVLTEEIENVMIMSESTGATAARIGVSCSPNEMVIFSGPRQQLVFDAESFCRTVVTVRVTVWRVTALTGSVVTAQHIAPMGELEPRNITITVGDISPSTRLTFEVNGPVGRRVARPGKAIPGTNHRTDSAVACASREESTLRTAEVVTERWPVVQASGILWRETGEDEAGPDGMTAYRGYAVGGVSETGGIGETDGVAGGALISSRPLVFDTESLHHAVITVHAMLWRATGLTRVVAMAGHIVPIRDLEPLSSTSTELDAFTDEEISQTTGCVTEAEGATTRALTSSGQAAITWGTEHTNTPIVRTLHEESTSRTTEMALEIWVAAQVTGALWRETAENDAGPVEVTTCCKDAVGGVKKTGGVRGSGDVAGQARVSPRQAFVDVAVGPADVMVVSMTGAPDMNLSRDTPIAEGADVQGVAVEGSLGHYRIEAGAELVDVTPGTPVVAMEGSTIRIHSFSLETITTIDVSTPTELGVVEHTADSAMGDVTQIWTDGHTVAPTAFSALREPVDDSSETRSNSESGEAMVNPTPLRAASVSGTSTAERGLATVAFKVDTAEGMAQEQVPAADRRIGSVGADRLTQVTVWPTTGGFALGTKGDGKIWRWGTSQSAITAQTAGSGTDLPALASAPVLITTRATADHVVGPTRDNSQHYAQESLSAIKSMLSLGSGLFTRVSHQSTFTDKVKEMETEVAEQGVTSGVWPTIDTVRNSAPIARAPVVSNAVTEAVRVDSAPGPTSEGDDGHRSLSAPYATRRRRRVRAFGPGSRCGPATNIHDLDIAGSTGVQQAGHADAVGVYAGGTICKRPATAAVHGLRRRTRVRREFDRDGVATLHPLTVTAQATRERASASVIQAAWRGSTVRAFLSRRVAVSLTLQRWWRTAVQRQAKVKNLRAIVQASAAVVPASAQAATVTAVKASVAVLAVGVLASGQTTRWTPDDLMGSTDWPSTLAGETRGDYALHRGALDSADTDAGTAVEVAVDGDDHKLSSLFPAIDMTRSIGTTTPEGIAGVAHAHRREEKGKGWGPAPGTADEALVEAKQPAISAIDRGPGSVTAPVDDAHIYEQLPIAATFIAVAAEKTSDTSAATTSSGTMGGAEAHKWPLHISPGQWETLRRKYDPRRVLEANFSSLEDWLSQSVRRRRGRPAKATASWLYMPLIHAVKDNAADLAPWRYIPGWKLIVVLMRRAMVMNGVDLTALPNANGYVGRQEQEHLLHLCPEVAVVVERFGNATAEAFLHGGLIPSLQAVGREFGMADFEKVENDALASFEWSHVDKGRGGGSKIATGTGAGVGAAAAHHRHPAAPATTAAFAANGFGVVASSRFNSCSTCGCVGVGNKRSLGRADHRAPTVTGSTSSTSTLLGMTVDDEQPHLATEATGDDSGWTDSTLRSSSRLYGVRGLEAGEATPDNPIKVCRWEPAAGETSAASASRPQQHPVAVDSMSTDKASEPTSEPAYRGESPPALEGMQRIGRTLSGGTIMGPTGCQPECAVDIETGTFVSILSPAAHCSRKTSAYTLGNDSSSGSPAVGAYLHIPYTPGDVQQAVGVGPTFDMPMAPISPLGTSSGKERPQVGVDSLPGEMSATFAVESSIDAAATVSYAAEQTMNSTGTGVVKTLPRKGGRRIVKASRTPKILERGAFQTTELLRLSPQTRRPPQSTMVPQAPPAPAPYQMGMLPTAVTMPTAPTGTAAGSLPNVVRKRGSEVYLTRAGAEDSAMGVQGLAGGVAQSGLGIPAAGEDQVERRLGMSTAEKGRAFSGASGRASPDTISRRRRVRGIRSAVGGDDSARIPQGATISATGPQPEIARTGQLQEVLPSSTASTTVPTNPDVDWTSMSLQRSPTATPATMTPANPWGGSIMGPDRFGRASGRIRDSAASIIRGVSGGTHERRGRGGGQGARGDAGRYGTVEIGAGNAQRPIGESRAMVPGRRGESPAPWCGGGNADGILAGPSFTQPSYNSSNRKGKRKAKVTSTRR